MIHFLVLTILGLGWHQLTPVMVDPQKLLAEARERDLRVKEKLSNAQNQGEPKGRVVSPGSLVYMTRLHAYALVVMRQS